MPDTEIKPPLLKELLPAEMHGKEYLKDWLEKPLDKDLTLEVFKKLDGAQSLIGKKTGMPAADAKDEEWDKFLAQLRPSKADDYKIPVREGATPDEAFTKSLREAFLAGDINQRQAQKFMTRMSQDLALREKAVLDEKKRLDAEFDTLARATLGDQNKQVMARVRKEMEAHAPAAVKPHLDKLDDNSLVILTATIHGILKQYASEDDLNNGGGSGDGGADLRKQVLELRKTKEYTDPFSPGHEAMKTKVNAMYKEIAAQAGKK